MEPERELIGIEFPREQVKTKIEIKVIRACLGRENKSFIRGVLWFVRGHTNEFSFLENMLVHVYTY